MGGTGGRELAPIELGRLRQVTAAIAADAAPTQRLALALGELTRLSGGTRSVIAVRPQRIARACGLVARGDEPVPVGDGAAVVVEGALADLVLHHEGSSGPILAEGGQLLFPDARVCVEDPFPSLSDDPERMALLAALADLAASAVHSATRADEANQRAVALEGARAKLHDQNRLLAELAVTDEVTSLPNRRYFHQRLEDEIGRLQRYRRPLALVLLDVDFFKQVNDTYGHPVGDRVLRHVADTAQRAARRVDLVARYGGDEFAVLMPETDAEGAAVVAQRLQRMLLQHDAPEEIRHVQVTLSIGVAGVDGTWRGGSTALVREADEALYEAKQGGRDRIAVRVVR